MEQWRDSGYFEWLDNFGGKFEDQYFGFEDGGRFDHRSYFCELKDLIGIVRMIWCLARCSVVNGDWVYLSQWLEDFERG